MMIIMVWSVSFVFRVCVCVMKTIKFPFGFNEYWCHTKTLFANHWIQCTKNNYSQWVRYINNGKLRLIIIIKFIKYFQRLIFRANPITSEDIMKIYTYSVFGCVVERTLIYIEVNIIMKAQSPPTGYKINDFDLLLFAAYFPLTFSFGWIAAEPTITENTICWRPFGCVEISAASICLLLDILIFLYFFRSFWLYTFYISEENMIVICIYYWICIYYLFSLYTNCNDVKRTEHRTPSAP